MKPFVWFCVSGGICFLSPLAGQAQEVSSGAAAVDTIAEAFDESDQAFEAALGQEPDCEVACDAFGAMERVAEKLCELEPGTRCRRAKQRVADAAQRLRLACPDCEAAREEVLREVDADGDDDEPAKEMDQAPSPVQAGPPPAPESKRGSCAACTIGAEDTGAGERAAAATLLILVGALLRRRRQRASHRARCASNRPR